MRKSIYLALAVMVMMAACRKSEDTTPKVQEKDNYFPMKTGNYWVYENYQVNPENERSLIDRIDSIFIDSVVTKNNHEYYSFKGIVHPHGETVRPLGYFRDSSSCLVDDHGVIHFSSTNFTDTLYSQIQYVNENDTLYFVSYSMQPEPTDVILGSGTYHALDYQGNIYVPNHPEPNLQHRITNTYYSEGIGKIFFEVVFVYGPTRIQKELLHYHINE